MNTEAQLIVDGQVRQTLQLNLANLRQLPLAEQIDDVRHLGAKREGQAVRLEAVLRQAQVSPDATHLGLHGVRDDFHASIPLEPVLHRGLIIYAVAGQPLAVEHGGPFRFFIPDHSACHLDEIDECANVKYLDRIELTVGKGFDNRPQDDEEHARLHEQ